MRKKKKPCEPKSQTALSFSLGHSCFLPALCYLTEGGYLRNGVFRNITLKPCTAAIQSSGYEGLSGITWLTQRWPERRRNFKSIT